MLTNREERLLVRAYEALLIYGRVYIVERDGHIDGVSIAKPLDGKWSVLTLGRCEAEQR